MIRRASGGALLVLAVALAGLPALTWYSTPPPASPTSASGFAGAGELWLLPALALLIALAGARMLSAPLGLGGVVGRWAGPLSLTAGALALGFAIWACANIQDLSGGSASPCAPGEGVWPAADVSPWFRGVFWDDLLFLLNPPESTLTILALTDG